VMGYESDISTAGTGTFINEMIESAGGVNVAADAKGWVTINREYVLAKGPDVIVCWTDPGKENAAKAHWSALPSLPAGKGGRVFAVSDRFWTIPGSRTEGLVESLAHMIHPEISQHGGK